MLLYFMVTRLDKQRLDMNQEVYKHRFCGQSQVAEQAHAKAYAPIIDANAETEKLKATERLKEEESFSKRHPQLVKAIIIFASILSCGVLTLFGLFKVKSVNNTKTATGSELGDSAIKTIGVLSVIGGSIGTVGAGIASAVSASKDSSTGAIIDEYREASMRETLNTSMELQEQHGEIARRLADINGEVAINVAEAQGNVIVEAINSGQIPVLSNGIRASEGFGVHNTPHIHEAMEVFEGYERRRPSQSRAGLGLDESRSSGQNITVYS